MRRFWATKRLYTRVHSDEILTEAWRKVRANSQVAGVDGLTVPQFESRLFMKLKEVQRELETRRYTPQAVKRLSLPKPDGRRRAVGILTVRDRIVQRAALEVIQPLFEVDFEESSYGFRPGRSLEGALEQVGRWIEQGYPWALDLDIDSFFDRIPVDRLYRRIRAKLHDRELLRLIRTWLELSALSSERRGWGFRRRERRRGVLQGSALSPLWANIYLDQFDKRARRAKMKTVRYADDILILTASQQEAKAALKWADRLLGALGLALNPHKTSLAHAEKGFDFLGQRVQLRPSDDSSEPDRMRMDLPESGAEPSESNGQAPRRHTPMAESLLTLDGDGDEEEEEEWDDDPLSD